MEENFIGKDTIEKYMSRESVNFHTGYFMKGALAYYVNT